MHQRLNIFVHRGECFQIGEPCLFVEQKFCTWAAVTAVALAVGAAATAAGVSYTVYSATNPPKTPQQASQALTRNQQQLAKLQAKLSQLQAAGKDTTQVQNAISKVNTSIAFLQNWLATNGNTPASAAKAAQAVSGTPVPSPVGSIASSSGANWPLIIGGGIAAVAVIGGATVLLKKKRK